MTLPLILDVAVKASVLVALAATVAALSNRSTAAHRHYLWALALGGLLVLPVLSGALPWRLPVVPVAAHPVVPVAYQPARVDPSPSMASPLAVPAPAPVAAPTADRFDRLDRATIPASTILWALWIAGAAVVLFRLAAGVLTLRWILRHAREVTDPRWHALLGRVAEQLDLRAPVQLLESPHANMPMALGFWRPIVVLPMESDSWSAELREVVLLHELAHVRRGDVRANLVGQLACALYWFHPLVWTAARRLRIEAERACDDLVLGAGAPASAYAGHLLTMVQASASNSAPAFAVPMAQRSAFEGRVLAILDPRQARHGVTRRAAAFGVVALLAVTVPLAALGPQQQQEPERVHRHALRNTSRIAARQAERIARTEVRVAAAAEVQATATQARAEARAEALAELASKGGHAQVSRQDNPVIIAGLVASLEDHDATVRLAAAQALGNRQDTASINALLVALRRDASREVRKTAAWALGEIEDARAVAGLLAALRDERDREVRTQIVWALGQIESDDAVPGLGAALRSEDDAEIRAMIVWALGEIESADAVPFLTPLLRDPDAEVREKAAWALGQIESAAAVEPLMAMLLAERVTTVRKQIVWALGEIEDRRAAPALEGALRDTSAEVRRMAIWALGQLDELHSAPAGLIAALRDGDLEVRRAAVQALAEIQDAASVPALIPLLRDDDLDVRRGAVRALGEIRGAAAVEALVAALRDADPEIRRMAARALGDR